MLNRTYPKHDINEIFDWINSILSVGDCANNAIDEFKFVNRLFAALPAEGVEYGMRFLHGDRELPKACDEILPLYIRFVNLLKYCEIIESLREIPTNPTKEEIMTRLSYTEELDEIEKPFCKPLLGYKFNSDTPEPQTDQSNSNIKNDLINESEINESSNLDSVDDNEDIKEGTSNLHLMNSLAAIFVCENPYVTAMFYEDKCCFSTYHLDDESMPHIRISRDNIDIVLVKGDVSRTNRDSYGIPYDLYIYASEPKLLEMELQSKNVNIIKTLPDLSSNDYVNREFVFEDVDGRHICVSQRDFT